MRTTRRSFAAACLGLAYALPHLHGRASASSARMSSGNIQQASNQQAATPSGPQISPSDRVYTADQSSNTVTVINPATNEVLGTIAIGQPRVNGVLGPVDHDQVNVHGLGFSPDGRFLNVISVTSNAAQVIDTATNEIVLTTYVGRAPHEGFISPNGSELWVAVRGEDYVSVIDLATGEESDRLTTALGASKVVFSPDGTLAFVNHLDTNELAVISVPDRAVTERVPIPEAAGGSADLEVSPDGKEVWLGHPGSGKTTVVGVENLEVAAVLDTGPRTNHPNFVTTSDGSFAYVTIGGLNHTKVFQRSGDPGAPELVATIENTGVGPHGIWPSPDSTRVYVALQKSDAIDVIDTATRQVIDTLRVGQDPQALVYVAGAVPTGTDGTANLTQQGLGYRIENLPIEVRGVVEAAGTASIRDMGNLEEIDITANGLPPNQSFTVYASDGETAVAIMNVMSDRNGTVPEALAFTDFFENYDRVILAPKGESVDLLASPAASRARPRSLASTARSWTGCSIR